jgi:hypothetical protein
LSSKCVVYLRDCPVSRLTFEAEGTPSFQLEQGGHDLAYVRVLDDKQVVALISPGTFQLAVVQDHRLQIEQVVPVLEKLKAAIEEYEKPEGGVKQDE